MRLMGVADVMEALPGMSQRSARKVMGEIGVTVVRHTPYVLREAFERYIADRTPSTFYNRPSFPNIIEIPKRRRA